MDNVAFHKTKLFKDFIHSICSKVLYTPPYSPQYNPIELAFSKIKSVYRKVNFTNDDMEYNVLQSIRSITSENLKAFYKHVESVIDAELAKN